MCSYTIYHLVRLLRLKNVKTLEEALSYVFEEENFSTVYNNKNIKFQSNNNNSNIIIIIPRKITLIEIIMSIRIITTEIITMVIIVTIVM